MHKHIAIIIKEDRSTQVIIEYWNEDGIWYKTRVYNNPTYTSLLRLIKVLKE